VTVTPLAEKPVTVWSNVAVKGIGLVFVGFGAVVVIATVGAVAALMVTVTVAGLETPRPSP
jgi:hypothetical protein